MEAAYHNEQWLFDIAMLLIHIDHGVAFSYLYKKERFVMIWVSMIICILMCSVSIHLPISVESFIHKNSETKAVTWIMS